MRLRLLGLMLLVACTAEPAGIGNGGVEPVVGQHCTQSHTVTAEGNDWRVRLYLNETSYRDVAGTDGIVRRQEVRSCRQRTCLIIGGVGLMSASEALAQCQG
jgi:hypothetical protein